MKGVLDLEHGATYAPIRERDETLLTSTDAAHALNRRVTELDDVPHVTGPSGTRRYLPSTVDEILHPPEQLTGRDRRDLVLACAGGAVALAAIVWGIVR